MKRFPGTRLLSLAIAFAASAGSGSQAESGARQAAAPAGTAAAVIARTLDAMGGKARLEALRTLRLETVNTPASGVPVQIDYTFIRPHRERKEVRGRTLIDYDGTRISVQVLDPATGPHPPRIEPPERNRDFEIEIGYYVPAFLDHPAEYAGLTEVDGRAFHQLRVTLPLGSRLTYAIDASTHLVARVRAEVPADGQFAVWGDRTWSDYRTVQGIRYPHAVASLNRDGTSTRTVVTRAEFSFLTAPARPPS